MASFGCYGSHEAAYSGGSCLRISGSEETLGLVQLYESYVSVKGNRFHVSYSVRALSEISLTSFLYACKISQD